jgi:hypothetical protein
MTGVISRTSKGNLALNMNVSAKTLMGSINEVLRENYAQMFAKYPNADLEFVEKVQDKLVKNVRIVWFLKAYRDYLGTLDPNEPHRGGGFFETSLNNLKHFYDLARANNLKEIEDYPLQGKEIHQVYSDFRAIEAKWLSSIDSRDILISSEEKRSGGREVFIEFPNKWKWVLKRNHACSFESQAMGHCGTAQDHEFLLSLREPGKPGQETPHVTVAWEEKTGLISQIKGRENARPVPKYHPYVLKLLQDPRVTGIGEKEDIDIDDESILEIEGVREALGDKLYSFLSYEEVARESKRLGKRIRLVKGDNITYIENGGLHRLDGPAEIDLKDEIFLGWYIDDSRYNPRGPSMMWLTSSSGSKFRVRSCYWSYKDGDQLPEDQLERLKRSYDKEEVFFSKDQLKEWIGEPV